MSAGARPRWGAYSAPPDLLAAGIFLGFGKWGGCSDSLQFGFKKKSSCIHALFTFNETVKHCTRQKGDKVFCGFLNASKAFDKVLHFSLFKKLLERGEPVALVGRLKRRERKTRHQSAGVEKARKCIYSIDIWLKETCKPYRFWYLYKYIKKYVYCYSSNCLQTSSVIGIRTKQHGASHVKPFLLKFKVKLT